MQEFCNYLCRFSQRMPDAALYPHHELHEVLLYHEKYSNSSKRAYEWLYPTALKDVVADRSESDHGFSCVEVSSLDG